LVDQYQVYSGLNRTAAILNFDFRNKFQQTSFPGVFLWERVTSDRIYPWVPEDVSSYKYTACTKYTSLLLMHQIICSHLPPFVLIIEFGFQNTVNLLLSATVTSVAIHYALFSMHAVFNSLFQSLIYEDNVR